MEASAENMDRLLEEQTVLRQENTRLKTEVKLLQEKVQCLMKKLFGRSSERLDPAQLGLEELRELQQAEARLQERRDKRDKVVPLSIPRD